MRPFILFAALIIGYSSITSGSDFKKINEFVSPEYMCISKDKKSIYISLSTYPGIAVFDVTSESLEQIIQMPAPVSGIVLDETKHILYTGSRDDKSQLFAVDLNNTKNINNIKVGYSPEGLAIAIKSKLLFSANRFTDNISVVSLENQKEIQRIKVLREPVALAVSPDEEFLAVANLLPVQSAVSSFISAQVSLVDIQSKEIVKNIDLPNGSFALKDVIFSNDGKYIYASHLIGRFNVLTSQIEKGWINTNAISVIDVQKKKLFTTVLLDDIYKGAANPSGLGISEDGKQLFVVVSGTHELFVIDREAMHSKIVQAEENAKINQSVLQVSKEDEKVKVFQKFSEIEQMKVLFEDIPKELGFLATVRKRIKLKGNGPARVISSNNKVYVSNYFSDGIEILDMEYREVNSKEVAIGNKAISESEVRFGEMLFHNAENCFQQWQSCASCHPGDGRVDGLNWDLMNDGIGNPKNTKSLLFAHKTPPSMVTGIRKDAETGVRAGFKYIQFFNVPEKNARAVDSYLKSLKPVKSPYLVDNKLSVSAKRGQEIFEALECNYCHSGQYYTNLKKYKIGTFGKYDKQLNWDTPTLIELWRTAPYLHDGRYSKLENVFEKEKHGIKETISAEDVNDLTNYLLSL